MSQRSTKPASKEADPLIQELRKEQLRQELSNYHLGRSLGVEGSSLTRIWNGTNTPGLPMIRKIIEVLREGNPKFTVTLP